MLLDYATLEERQGEPFSTRFDDIYYHPGHGIAESEHTFLQGNDIFARFAALDNGSFTIAETGFGTGLNFFLTAHHFLRLTTTAHLTYISAEKYPIAPHLLPALQQGWPCAELRAAFHRQNPGNHPGFHLLHLHPRIDLLLLMGDAATQYAQLDAQVDAWFLDGFAPTKNPDLWNNALWQQLARLSHEHTTAATFSAARLVRDGLARAGFIVERMPGFGRKRHMLRAQSQQRLAVPPNWHDRPAPHPPGKSIAIIGAGIAGSATAHALAKRGMDVHLYADPAQYPPASAVPVAIPYLQPGLTDTAQRRYQLTAWHYAQRLLHELARVHPHTFTPCPIHRLPPNDKAAQRHQQLHARQLLNASHWQLQDGCLSDLTSGIVHLPELCTALTDSPHIRRHTHAVGTLRHDAQGWHIAGHTYASVILCCGWHTALLPEAYARHALRPLRGQGTLFAGSRPDAVYCRDKTLIPLANGCYAGASYQPNDADMQTRKADRDANAAFARTFLTHADVDGDFTAIRASSRDYLPLVGGMAVSAALAKDYALWRHNAHAPLHAAPHYHPGLYLHAGLGSKGCTYAFLNAALLAAYLCATPLPLPRELLPDLAPARFFIRNLKRGQV